MKLAAIPLLAVGLVLGCMAVCHAEWAYLPLEDRIIGADLVVAGRLEDARPVEGERRLVGRLVIEEVIWSPIPDEKPVEAVELTWPEDDSKHAAFKTEQAGVWVLRRDHEKDRYSALYPGDFLLRKDMRTVRAVVRRLEELEWGTVREGLVICIAARPGNAAILDAGEDIAGLSTSEQPLAEGFTLTVLARNASDHSFLIAPEAHTVACSTLEGDDVPLGDSLPSQRIWRQQRYIRRCYELLPGRTFVIARYTVKDLPGARRYKFTAHYAPDPRGYGDLAYSPPTWIGKALSNTLTVRVTRPAGD